MNSQEIYTALTVYHEARGESIEGQVAVAHVILNRAIKRGLSVQQVVSQTKQFSCYNNGKPPIKDYHSFVVACEAVNRAREERLHGKNLYRATHYLNETLVIARRGRLPGWVGEMQKVAVIGQHSFYR